MVLQGETMSTGSTSSDSLEVIHKCCDGRFAKKARGALYASDKLVMNILLTSLLGGSRVDRMSARLDLQTKTTIL
jgi:hypothetical protein